jgi:hypothetical protein
MEINIIHLPHRLDRMVLLTEELANQRIENFKIWRGFYDEIVPAKGISRSHKQIVRYAQKNKFEEILIAEDDFKFTDKGAFQYFLDKKPEDFDLYLASVYFGNINSNNTIEDFCGLTFYIISARFYNTFLNIPEYDNLDRLLSKLGKYIVCNPFTVIQHNGYSDNQKSCCNYDALLSNRLLFKQNSS